MKHPGVFSFPLSRGGDLSEQQIDLHNNSAEAQLLYLEEPNGREELRLDTALLFSQVFTDLAQTASSPEPANHSRILCREKSVEP